MAADADRQLLIGLLALQNGLIDEAKLLAAIEAWAKDPGRRVVRLYEDWGKPEEAAEWKAKLGA
jgi:hypothetical protein